MNIVKEHKKRYMAFHDQLEANGSKSGVHGMIVYCNDGKWDCFFCSKVCAVYVCVRL